MTSEEFLAGLSGEPLHFAENILSQRDDALKRIADYDAIDASVKKAHSEAISGLQEQLNASQALVAALGGTDLAIKLAAQKRRAEAVAAITAAQAALAELDAQAAES